MSLPAATRDPTGNADQNYASAAGWIFDGRCRGRITFKKWGNFHHSVASVRDNLQAVSRRNATRKVIEPVLNTAKHMLNSGRPDRYIEEPRVRQIGGAVLIAVNDARKLVAQSRNNSTFINPIIFVQEHSVRIEHVAKYLTTHCNDAFSMERKPSVRPDFSLFAQYSDIDDDVLPLATIEIKGSGAIFVPDGVEPTSMDAIVSHFQNSFDSEPRQGAVGESFLPTKRLAEAIVHALHSSSGCGALYNHLFALYFYIDKKEAENSPSKVIIRLSRIYRCDSRLNNLHAFVAWTFAMEDLARNNCEGIKHVASCHKFLSRSAGAPDEDEDNAPRGSRSSSKSTSNTGSSPVRKKPRAGGNGKSGGRKSTKQGRASAGGKNCLRPESSEAIVQYVRDFEAFMQKSGLAQDVLADIQMAFHRYRDDEVVKRTLAENIVLLGEGVFGVVCQAKVGELEVAVKYCTTVVGDEMRSLHSLYNEIVVYCLIAANYRHLFRCALPKLIACGFAEVGPVLILEKVGMPLVIRERSLYIGSELACLKTVRALQASAVSGLKEIHACGIVHRDVALRNLRARRVGSEYRSHPHDEAVWQALWIDLGSSAVEGPENDFSYELERCSSIFNVVLAEGDRASESED